MQTSIYQRSAAVHFPKAKIGGDGPWICISTCSGEQIAYLFKDEILRDAKMLCCSKPKRNCKSTNNHIARHLKENVYIDPLTFQNPVNSAA